MAGTGTGLDSQLGFEEESVYGTAVTVARFLEFDSESIAMDVRKLEGPPSLGRGRFARHDRNTTYIAGAAGTTVHKITNKAFGKLLKLCLGNHVLTWPGSTNASQILTLIALPTTGDTVTIGTTVYTYRTTLTAVTTTGEVLIGATFAESLRNLANAINLGAGEGVYYGSLTPVHPQVVATYNATTLTATDKMALGTGANTIATTETLTNAGNVWTGITLLGGLAGTDTRYTQTLTPDDRGLRRRTATVQINRPSVDGIDRPFTFTGGKVVAWKLSVDTDGYAMLEVTWDFQTGVTSTALATASYASTAGLYDFVRFAATVGGTAVRIRSFEISATNVVATDRRFLGNTKLEPLANGEWVFTGTMDAEFTDLVAYAAFVAGTQAALVLTGTGITIPTSASPYLLSVTVPVIEYTGETPMVGGPDIVRQALPWKAYSNGSDALVTVVYNSSDTAA